MGERPEVGRRRLAPEARRAELLDAALEVFAEVGFERATLNDLADRAGVTKGAVYHYFASKDQLFIELVRSRLGDLVLASDARIVAAAPSARAEDLLREVLEETWRTLHQPRMMELSQLIMMELPKFPEVGRAFFDEVVLPARRSMRRIWDRKFHDHGDDERIEALIATIPSMLLGVAMTRRLLATIDPLRLDTEALGRHLADAMIAGVLAAPEA